MYLCHHVDESYTYSTSNPVVTTSEYRPAQTTYVSGTQPITTTSTYATGTNPAVYTSGGQQTTYVSGGQTNYVSGGTTNYVSGGQQVGYVSGGSNAQRAVAEEIPVESRIEYIPFEKKYIEYDKVERIEKIPYEREIV